MDFETETALSNLVILFVSKLFGKKFCLMSGMGVLCHKFALYIIIYNIWLLIILDLGIDIVAKSWLKKFDDAQKLSFLAPSLCQL